MGRWVTAHRLLPLLRSFVRLPNCAVSHCRGRHSHPPRMATTAVCTRAAAAAKVTSRRLCIRAAGSRSSGSRTAPPHLPPPPPPPPLQRPSVAPHGMGAGCQRGAGPVSLTAAAANERAEGAASSMDQHPVLLLDIMDTVRRLAVGGGAPQPSCGPIPNKQTSSRQCRISRSLMLLQVVYDPFFHDMPRFFNCTFKELLAAKHPTAWVQVGCAGTERCLQGCQAARQQHG